MNTIIFFIVFSISIIYSSLPEAEKKSRYLSYKEYKQAQKYFYNSNYHQALEHTEKSLKIYPRNKKGRKLLLEIKKVADNYLETGEALVYFDQSLALKYLNTANLLLNAKYDKKKIKKINKLLNYIKKSELNSSETETLEQIESM